MEPKVKPCPYCGQRPVISQSAWGSTEIECDNGNCIVTTHVGIFHGDPFIAWNTRPGEDRAAEREREQILAWLQSKIDSYAKPSNAMEASERWAYICARDYIIGRREPNVTPTAHQHPPQAKEPT
jgi:hypothetical protein